MVIIYSILLLLDPIVRDDIAIASGNKRDFSHRAFVRGFTVARVADYVLAWVQLHLNDHRIVTNRTEHQRLELFLLHVIEDLV